MPRTILLADDSVTIQKVVELTFMDEDYEVEAVGDGTAAIARLDSRCPDLLIADVHMPGADGYEVCRQAKERYPSLPVLLLVGTFEPFNAAAAQDAGADDHLKKPFDAQDLQQQVEELIVRSDAQTSPAPIMVDAVSTAGTEVPAVEPAAAQGVVENAWEPVAAEPAAPESVTEPSANPDFHAMPSFSFDDAPTEEAIGHPTAPASPSPAVESPFATALHKTAFPDPAPDFEPEAPTPAFETVHMNRSPLAPVDEAAALSVSEDNLPTQELDLQPPIVAAEPPAVTPETEIEAMVEEYSDSPLAVPEAIAAEPVLEAIAAEPVLEAVAVEDSAEPVPEASNNGGPLSDGDVDRIARRVVELLGEGVVREVAWEVVPDLAEVVIKERLRELEDQVG